MLKKSVSVGMISVSTSLQKVTFLISIFTSAKAIKLLLNCEKKMKQDLTTKNENTLYVVFDTKNNKVLFETGDKSQALSLVNRTANTDYSTYPPFTYAANKKDLAEEYETTMLEY